MLLLVWVLGESRPCDGPLVWSPAWRRVPARFQRAGALENAAEPDRPSGSEELPPGKTLKVRVARSSKPEQSIHRSQLLHMMLLKIQL